MERALLIQRLDNVFYVVAAIWFVLCLIETFSTKKWAKPAVMIYGIVMTFFIVIYFYWRSNP